VVITGNRQRDPSRWIVVAGIDHDHRLGQRAKQALWKQRDALFRDGDDDEVNALHRVGDGYDLRARFGGEGGE
jgi:hypothetical protein